MQQVYFRAGTRLFLLLIILSLIAVSSNGIVFEEFDPSPKNIESRLVRGELKTGIPYAFLPKKSPGETVHLNLKLRFGDEKSLMGKSAAVRILGTLMERGTKTLSPQQLSHSKELLKASISITSELQTLNMIVKTNRTNLIDVLDLISDILRNPALDENEFSFAVNQTLARLENQKQEPKEVAIRTVSRALNSFKRGDARYLPTFDEEHEDYKKLKLSEVKDIHAKFLSGTEGEVAGVGEFDAKLVEEKLSAMLLNWKSKIAYQRIAASATTEVKIPLQFLETPEKADSFYFASQQYAIRDDHPKYPALLIANIVLGDDNFPSRLSNRIKLEEGFAHGISSEFVASQIDERASFSIQAIAKPLNRDKLVKIIDEEIRKFAKDGLSAKELKDSLQNYLQKQIVRRSDDAQLANILAINLFTGRTMEYHDKLETDVSHLTVEHVNDAISEYIAPDGFVIAIAGDFVKPTRQAVNANP